MTTLSRYQVLDCTLNCLVTFDKAKELAFALGKNYAIENPDSVVEVFDVMARFNCADTWRYNPHSKGFYATHYRHVTDKKETRRAGK